MYIIPDLTCKNLSDAKSYMIYSKLSIGNIRDQINGVSENEMWISSQFPESDGLRKLKAGQTIDITVSKIKPANCN